MNLFDQLVNQAMQNLDEVVPLRVVVEKELLHHDIIREMSTAGLLKELTLMGGTCLRACYGSNRLSEDLDFTGGKKFSRTTLIDLGSVLVDTLKTKYSLDVTVSEPTKDTGNVDTWKLKMVTRPSRKDLPMQRINIDICAIPSYQIRPVIIRNHYGVDMGTSGLIIHAQSREEILADKIIAFVLRPNRLKNRDLWDIGWLKQQNVEMPLNLIPKKLDDHRRGIAEFLDLLKKRKQLLLRKPELHTSFVQEMKRFLPPQIVSETIENEHFWSYLTNLIDTECQQVEQSLTPFSNTTTYKM